MSGVNVMGGETNIVFFGPDIGDVVNSGGQEVVVGPGYGYTYGHSNAYGTTYGTVVNSGGQESVQGGVIIGTLVNDVGQEFVSGGSAIGTVVNGEQYVYGGNFVGVGSVDGLATSTTVNSGGEQYVYDYATAKPVGTFMSHKHWAQSLAVSPNGQWIASTAWGTMADGELRLWNARGLRPIGEVKVPGENQYVSCGAINRSGKLHAQWIEE